MIADAEGVPQPRRRGRGSRRARGGSRRTMPAVAKRGSRLAMPAARTRVTAGNSYGSNADRAVSIRIRGLRGHVYGSRNADLAVVILVRGRRSHIYGIENADHAVLDHRSASCAVTLQGDPETRTSGSQYLSADYAVTSSGSRRGSRGSRPPIRGLRGHASGGSRKRGFRGRDTCPRTTQSHSSGSRTRIARSRRTIRVKNPEP
jgi:hypothetical protein